jgi:hypothetical protein
MKPMSERCQSCKFWEKLSKERQPHGWMEDTEEIDGTIVLGRCRRRAPVATFEMLLNRAKWPIAPASVKPKQPDHEMIEEDVPYGEMQALWPMTDRGEWCGDFEK